MYTEIRVLHDKFISAEAALKIASSSLDSYITKLVSDGRLETASKIMDLIDVLPKNYKGIRKLCELAMTKEDYKEPEE